MSARDINLDKPVYIHSYDDQVSGDIVEYMSNNPKPEQGWHHTRGPVNCRVDLALQDMEKRKR